MSAVPASAWREARRLLCVRLDNVGDVLMTTPALHALRHVRPDRRLTLLTSRSAAALAPHLEDVDEVIAYDTPWVRNEADDSVAADLALIDRLRADGFDAAVIFTVHSQSALPAALCCRLAGIPLRLAHCRENPYRLLSDWVRDPEPGAGIRHEVQRQLDLVATVGAHAPEPQLRFRVQPGNRQRCAARLARLGLDESTPWILLHPGATAASRRYPPELFAAAARLLWERLHLPLVFGGSPGEIEMIESIRAQAGVPTHSLAGATTLGDYGAAIESAAVLVSSNSAPVHIAAALGTPVIDLYALTNPQHTPWQVPSRVLSHDVPCRNCLRSVCPHGHHLCLRGVAPERVADATTGLLAELAARELAA